MTLFRTKIEDLGLLEAKRFFGNTGSMELKIGGEHRHIVEVVNGVEGGGAFRRVKNNVV